ncbi:MAG: hypothetical protein PVG07_11325 [Acidobacteriota bacterium]|jgi:hypothetical protein
MSDFAPFDYTDTELRSYLPTGWTLLTTETGEIRADWNPKKRIWSTRIEDTADMPWVLEVRADEVEKDGRLDALKRAMDRLYVDRLGKRTRGLGF